MAECTTDLGSVHDVLHTIAKVEYNLHRQGKCFFGMSLFARQWRDLGPRTYIERRFAWLRRHFGLNHFRVQGCFRVIQVVSRVYIAALIVACIAARRQWPELVTLCLKVLAFVNT